MCRLYSIKMEHRYLGKRKTFSLLFHEFHFFLVAFSRKEKICVDLLNCMHGKKGLFCTVVENCSKRSHFTTLRQTWCLLCGDVPQKGGRSFQIRKVRHFWWFYPIVLLLSSQTELESGILKWDSKKFFVKPTTFEGHLMRHLHKFGQ